MLDNGFEQKKRNRAIAITDIAISKVPRTHIFGFTDEQNAFIQEQHKEVLRRARILCQKYKNNEMEFVFLIHLHTWNIWSIEGKRPRAVYMSDNEEANAVMQQGYKNSMMVMHNHPSTGTFSGEDYKMFCDTDSLYLITVVGNDGSIYVLMKNYDFDKTVALSAYGELTKKYSKYRNNATRAMKDILSNAQAYGLTYKKGRKKL